MGRKKILDEFTNLPVPPWRKWQLRRAKLWRSGGNLSGKGGDRSNEVMRARKDELKRLDQEITRLHEEVPGPYTEDTYKGGAHAYIFKASRLIRARLKALSHQEKSELLKRQ